MCVCVCMRVCVCVSWGPGEKSETLSILEEIFIVKFKLRALP